MTDSDTPPSTVADSGRSPLPLRRFLLHPDILLCAVVILLGSWVGHRTVRDWTPPGEFYQEYFGAAAMYACGRGFVNPNHEASPAFVAFMSRTVDTLRCDDIPEGLPFSRPSQFQRAHVYLMKGIGWTWWLNGVAWSGTAVLAGLLFGFALVAAYGLFRLAAGRAASAAGIVLLMASPVQLAMAPHLRDFAKAPFILAALFLTGLLVVRRGSWLWLATLAFAYGLVIGVGIGFRVDCLIALPLFFAALLIGSTGTLRDRAREFAIGAAAFLVPFGLAGGPVIQALGEGGNSPHVILLGFMSPFDKAIGVTTPFYEWGYLYNDSHATALINAHAAVNQPGGSVLAEGTRAYDEAGSVYLTQIVSHFPADMLARLYGATLKVLDLPVTGLANQLYLDPNEQKLSLLGDCAMANYRRIMAPIIRLFRGIGALAWVLALLVISRRSLKEAAFLLGSLLYVCGYGVLQFSTRNYFHLEFAGIWGVLFVLSAASRWVRSTADVPATSGGRLSGTRRMLIFAAGAAAVLGGSLVAARAWQARIVDRLIATIAAAPAEALPVAATVTGDHVLLVPAGGSPEGGPPRTQYAVDYLVVDVAEQRPAGVPGGPNALPEELFVRYERTPLAPGAYWDPTRTYSLTVPWSRWSAPDAVTRLVIPVYDSPEVRFAGIQVPNARVSIIKAIRRVAPPRLMPFVWLTLRPGWERQPRYQELRGWRDGPTPTLPDDIAAATTIATPMRPAHAVLTAEPVRRRGDTFLIDGRVGSRQTLVQYWPSSVQRGNQFIVRGFNYWGCIEVILVKPGQFLTRSVVDPGRFTVVLEVPEDGEYIPVIAGAQCLGPMRVDLASLGWRDRPLAVKGGVPTP